MQTIASCLSQIVTNISISIENETISASKCVKLLGVNIDNKLDYNEHISSIFKKVSLKLHALARIFRFMNEHKLRIPMTAFIESQFDYCPLKWIFHSRASNNPYLLRYDNEFKTDNIHTVSYGLLHTEVLKHGNLSQVA